MTYKVVKLDDNVLVYDTDTPDHKQEFMDAIDARPGDVFRFSYNGWLEYLGNDFDDAIDRANRDQQARQLLTTIQDSKL